MGVNLKTETVVDLNQASRYLGLGRNRRPMHLSTLVRAITRGVKGHRLEALRIGNRWLTSIEALQRWGERQAAASASPVGESPHRTSAARRRSDERAAAELDRRGI
jgi:hypothetical protein